MELVVHSHGHLHVFLPLLDRGVDALVHRIDDGSWFPIHGDRSPTWAESWNLNSVVEPQGGINRLG